MNIGYLPSLAQDYEFIILAKFHTDIYYFYSVAENGWYAEQLCKEIQNDGGEGVIIHNVRIQGRKRR